MTYEDGRNHNADQIDLVQNAVTHFFTKRKTYDNTLRDNNPMRI